MEAGQKVFNSLGININFAQELSYGKVLDLSLEQKDLAQKERYTFPVVIPGHLPRKEIIHKVKTKFFNKFGSGGIYFYTEDSHLTEQAKHTLRPKQLYLIYLRPEREISQAHGETLNKTLLDCQKILKQTNQANPKLNLKGLTLEEFLMAQATLDEIQNAHFDSETTTWLLEEQILDYHGNPERCLRAYFRATSIGVSSCLPNSTRPKRGARFAVVPEAAKSNP